MGRSKRRHERRTEWGERRGIYGWYRERIKGFRCREIDGPFVDGREVLERIGGDGNRSARTDRMRHLGGQETESRRTCVRIIYPRDSKDSQRDGTF